jgi:glycine/D-amino acid oxidase-like deaminating enzyme
MTIQSTRAQRVSAPTGSVEFDADVLVIGGGPAGTWAAISAAEQGARVVLADKGFCGTSGATAAAGTGVWYVDPDPALRDAAMANREKLGGHLQDRRWMARVLVAPMSKATGSPTGVIPIRSTTTASPSAIRCRARNICG